MCRDKDHGGRRCPNDGAVARRLRRQNAKKKVEFADEVIEPTEPQNLDIEPIVIPEEVKETNEVDEKAKVIIADIEKTLDEYRKATPETPGYKDRLKYHSTELTDDEIKSEQLVITLGNRVEELAKLYGTPSDEDFDKYEESLKEVEREYRAKSNENFDKLNAELGIELHKKGQDGERYIYAEDIVNAKVSFDPARFGARSERFFHKDEYKRLKEAGVTSADSKYMAIYEEREDINLMRDLGNGFAEKHREILINKRAEAYRKALEASGVEFAGDDDLKMESDVPADYAKKIQTIAKYYPKSWVETAQREPLKIEYREGRAGYYNGFGYSKMKVSRNPDESTVVHELGHHMEAHNVELSQAQRRFLYRRSGMLAHQNKEIRKKPKPSTVYSGRSEWGYRDNFADGYIGKVYDYNSRYSAKDIQIYGQGDKHFEILTTGMESTFFGKHGAGVGLGDRKKDPEHTHFILGLLATSAKK